MHVIEIHSALHSNAHYILPLVMFWFLFCLGWHFRFLPTRLNVFVNLNCALLLLLFLFNDLQKKRIIQKEIFKKSRAKVDIYIELQYISSNPPLGFFSTNIPLIIQTTAFQNKLINLLYEKYMILGSETFYQKIISYQTISSF